MHDAWYAPLIETSPQASHKKIACSPRADQRLYPNPRCRDPPHLAYFTFLGRLLGKALYEGILVEPTFADFFLRKLLGRANTPDDLPSLDAALATSLRRLSRFEGACAAGVITMWFKHAVCSLRTDRRLRVPCAKLRGV